MKELKTLCAKEELLVGGNKPELIARLLGTTVSADDASTNTIASSIFCVLDMETANSDKFVDNILSLAAIMVDFDGTIIADMPVFNTFIKPPEYVEFASVNSKVNGIYKGSSCLKGAPGAKVAMENFAGWLAALQQWYGLQGRNAPLHVVLTGHNVTACDIPTLWHLFKRHNIQLPPFVQSFWDTLSAIRPKKSNPLHTRSWQPHPNQPASFVNDLTMPSLYQKLVLLRPDERDTSVVAGKDHTVVQDVRMCIAVAHQPDVWRYRLQKGSGVQPLSHLFDREERKYLEREHQVNQNLRLPAGWTQVTTPMQSNEHPEKMYTGQKYGPKGDAKSAPANLAEMFDRFLCKEDLEVIVGASVYYALEEPVILDKRGPKGQRDVFHRCAADHPDATRRCKVKDWLGMTVDSVSTFFGICYLLGAHHVQVVHDAWKQDSDFRIPGVAEAMREEVFLQHLKFLHFQPRPRTPATPQSTNPEWFKAAPADQQGAPPPPLEKVRAFHDVIRSNFAKLWDMGFITVWDESGIPMKCRLSCFGAKLEPICIHYFSIVCAELRFFWLWKTFN